MESTRVMRFPFFRKRKKQEQRNQPVYLTSGMGTGLDTINYVQEPLTIPVVLATIKMLAEDISRLPIHVYERRGSTRRIVTQHHLESILNDECYTNILAINMRRAIQSIMCAYGNAYIYIERDEVNGEILGLLPMPLHTVSTIFDRTGILKHYQLSNGTIVQPRDMLHMFQVSLDAKQGISLVQSMRHSLSLASASEQYAHRFIDNNAQPGSVLQWRPGNNTSANTVEDNERIRAAFEEIHRGVQNAGRVAVVPSELEYIPNARMLPREDAQLVNTRIFQKRDWAMLLRIPNHLIGDLERATYSNIEHQSIEYVKYCLVPYLRTWEKTLNNKLFTEQEKERGLFIKHNLDELLRGDITTRINAYKTLHEIGALTVDEIRAFEDLPPL